MKDHIQNVFGVFEDDYDLLLRKACSIMGNSHDAEDAMQALAMRMLENQDSFFDIKNYRAFLSKCLRNECLMILRKNRKYMDVACEISQNIPSPGNSYADVETRDIVDRLLEGCSEEMKEVFIHHVIDGYTIVDIAKTMGLSANTLGRRLQRLRKTLVERYFIITGNILIFTICRILF